MAEAHEALRKDMQQEATQELVDRQGLVTLFIVVSGITPAKGDLVIGEGGQAADYISQLSEEGLLRPQNLRVDGWESFPRRNCAEALG